MLSPLMFICTLFTIIVVCKGSKAANDKLHPLAPITSFVDMKDCDTAYPQLLGRRTSLFENSDFLAMHNLESIIYNLKNINDTVNFDLIWSLSKRIQFSSANAIEERFQKLCQFVEEHILSEKLVFFNNPKARNLMHALGFKSIGIHEYNALNLYDDEHICKLSITDSGIKKLKLLLLASRGQENHLTAVLSDSIVFQQSTDIQEREYNKISSTHNIANVPVWIWFNFPWLSAPKGARFASHTFILYFGALYEFLWTRYHHEFGFPKYDTIFRAELHDQDMVKKIEFVKYMMDRYRFRIHDMFSESKRDTLRWMEQYVQQIGPNDTNLEVRTAQRSMWWVMAEAVRLNKLLMSDDDTLSNQFMTHYVLAIAEEGVLTVMMPFVRRIIQELIKFNGPGDNETTLRLRVVLRRINKVRVG